MFHAYVLARINVLSPDILCFLVWRDSVHLTDFGNVLVVEKLYQELEKIIAIQ